jgi:hypothetical protein
MSLTVVELTPHRQCYVIAGTATRAGRTTHGIDLTRSEYVLKLSRLVLRHVEAGFDLLLGRNIAANSV